MRRKAEVQYTVRDVPGSLDRALRRRARQRRVSLNRQILDELLQAVLGEPKRADFSDLLGALAPDAELDAALAAQRRVDEDLWR
jgi:hypothetical protein